MTRKLGQLLALAALAGLVLGLAALVAAVLWSDLTPEERTVLAAMLEPRAGLVLFTTLLAVVLAGMLAQPAIRAYVTGAARLAEQARIMLGANPDLRIEVAGAPEIRELARAFNGLADRAHELREEVDAKIAAAKASVEAERNRLAALMSELTQGVLVCNRDGRILLYNQRARKMFNVARKGTQSGLTSLVGLGRSIFGIIERNLVVHALETVERRFAQGHPEPVARFVSTAPSGELLRVQMAPVRGGASAEGGGDGTAGFVLTLENITRAVEEESRRDHLLQSLTEGSRQPLANIRAAVENLLEYPDIEAAQQSRFLHVIGDEASALSTRLDETLHSHADALKTRWPLENMLGADLLAAARRRIEARVGVLADLDSVDSELWVRVDSFSMVQALAYLAGRLKAELGVREVRFRLAPAGRHAELDLAWRGAGVSPSTMQAWEHEPMRAGGEESPLSLSEVMERHGGEVWHQVDRGALVSYFRLLVPLTNPEPTARQTAPATPSRPEYYDFDLFHQPGQTPDLDERALAELAYTVFDTETTGLEPSQGDEIISIGALRIVNARLLRHEAFDQLVDPRRPLTPESIPIHGITPDMLVGQPTIAEVLPAFHQFCEDTVLVAHNAAFDMRFLQLKEEATGVRFTHPVLDTLLLSAVLHPHQNAHRLEAIAERLGVNVVGRHTALGDAIVTGEVFLKMIPLLAEHGIRTLGDARAAAERTYYARISY
jgi:DNA polymerase-3 subunit epsilon